MSFTPGSGAIIILGVDGAAASQRDIESVADALRRLNDADFRRLNGQISGVQEHMGKLKSMVAGVFMTVVAGLSIAAFTNMVSGAIEAAGSMNDLAIQTGASAAALMQFKTIGATSDTTIEGIAGAMNKLAKGMAVSNEESKGLGQALTAIGVDFNSLKRMAPEQQMLTVARAMDQFQDGTGKAAVAMTLYGKEGAKMLPFLKDLADEADNVTAALTAQEIESKKALAAMADNFGDNLTKIKLASAESKKAISLGMLPALYEASEAFLQVTGAAGGLKETVARLSKDGTIADWTRTAITGVTYLMDAFQILARVVTSVGKVIGGTMAVYMTSFAGLANAMKLFANGQFAESWTAMRSMATANGAVISGVISDIGDEFSSETFGGKLRAGMAAIKGVGAAAADAKKQVDYSAAGDEAATARKSKEQSAYESLILSIREKVAAGQVEISGYKQLSESQQLTIKLDELLRAGKIANVKANLDVARTLIAERAAQESVIESQKRAASGAEAMAKVWKEYTDTQAKSLDEAIKTADQNEKLVATFGMTKGAIEGLELARLEEQLAQRASLGLTLDEIESLEKLIVAKKRSAAAAATIDGLEEQKKMWESIDKTAHDTFTSIFDSGKSAFDRLRDTLKNGLLDLLYQMTIKKWIFNIGASVSGTGVAGVAQAATGGGSGIGLSSLGTLGSLSSGLGLLGAGGLGLQAGFGALMSGGLAGISGAVSGGIAAIGAGTASSIAAGMGTIAGALGPIALGVGAAVALWKHFDTGGTEHTGGASSATSAGARSIDSAYIGFTVPRRDAQVDAMTAGLASGIVSILDSTALTFGKTAGYTAATAFADDSSKDGAWGALAITKLGEKVLNWQDTQTSRWAPKEFADGAAGQTQYLAALSGSVRTALNSIGLPDWATNMLDALGSGASIEDLAKVVDQINGTQQALATLGASIKGFAGLSSETTSALMAASGGIASLASNASAYYNAFYTDSEKSASGLAEIKTALASVGVQMPNTLAAYRAEVEARMAMGDAGVPAVAMLLKSAGAFAQLQPALEAVASDAHSAADILSERNDLQKQYDELTMTSAELLAQQRDALDESNRALFDQVRAASAAKKAQDAAKASLGDVISRMTSFGDSARALRDGLLTGSLSDRTPEQQYAEARKQYEQTLAAAKSGDERAQGRYEETVNTFLTASQKLFSGDAQYSADLAGVLATSDEMAAWASDQVDLAQQSLDAMTEQVTGINNLNATMQSIAQTVSNLAGPAGPVPTFDTSVNYAEMGRLDMAPLVAEIKALRAEVREARIERQQQTGDLIERNDQVTRTAAETVAAGMRDAAVDGAWVAGRPAKRGVS